MRKVFWENPYQHTLITRVASVDGNKILFEETIAYSFCGGQESDKATVNGIEIINSIKDDKNHLIYYFLPETHGLKQGDEVTMIIDWPRRYRLMRLHFAAELVLEIVTKRFNLMKVGAHISEAKSRIDFTCAENISQHFEAILNEFNQIIKDNRKIQTGYTDLREQRRFWKIEGFAQVPCGGTHVRSTTEIGYVTLKRERANRGTERINIVPVDNAVPEYTALVYKEFKPIIPRGLKYSHAEGEGHRVLNAAGIYLGITPQQLHRDVVEYAKTHINAFQEVFFMPPDIFLSKVEKWNELSDQQVMQLLSLTLQRQIVIITPEGVKYINNQKFRQNEAIFIYCNGQYHYDALRLTGEVSSKEILPFVDISIASQAQEKNESSQLSLSTGAKTQDQSVALYPFWQSPGISNPDPLSRDNKLDKSAQLSVTEAGEHTANSNSGSQRIA